MISQEEIYKTLCERHTLKVQDQLLKGKVAIVGLGGLGSNIAVALARAGVGHLKLIDFDKVDLSNLNRQQYRIKDIGRNKTQALQEILTDINPYLDLSTYTGRVNEENAMEILKDADVICEATDVPETKAMIVDLFFTYFAQTKKLVAGSGMAGYVSSNLIHTREVCRNFYLCGDEENGLERGLSLMAPRVSICSGHEANMVLRLLLGEEEA